jgi:hypothetical protein
LYRSLNYPEIRVRDQPHGSKTLLPPPEQSVQAQHRRIGALELFKALPESRPAD